MPGQLPPGFLTPWAPAAAGTIKQPTPLVEFATEQKCKIFDEAPSGQMSGKDSWQQLASRGCLDAEQRKQGPRPAQQPKQQPKSAAPPSPPKQGRFALYTSLAVGVLLSLACILAATADCRLEADD